MEHAMEEDCADELKRGEEFEEGGMEYVMEERGKKKEKKGDRNGEESEDCEKYEDDDDRESVVFENECAEEWKSVGKNLRCSVAWPRHRIRGPCGGEATAGEQRRG